MHKHFIIIGLTLALIGLSLGVGYAATARDAAWQRLDTVCFRLLPAQRTPAVLAAKRRALLATAHGDIEHQRRTAIPEKGECIDYHNVRGTANRCHALASRHRSTAYRTRRALGTRSQTAPLSARGHAHGTPRGLWHKQGNCRTPNGIGVVYVVVTGVEN